MVQGTPIADLLGTPVVCAFRRSILDLGCGVGCGAFLVAFLGFVLGCARTTTSVGPLHGSSWAGSGSPYPPCEYNVAIILPSLESGRRLREYAFCDPIGQPLHSTIWAALLVMAGWLLAGHLSFGAPGIPVRFVVWSLILEALKYGKLASLSCVQS